jgi:heme exporter protein C
MNGTGERAMKGGGGRGSVLEIGLGVLTLLSLLLAVGLVFFYAPQDAVQGIVQKVFYLHVPSAWIGMLAFVVTAVAGIIYLWKKNIGWDCLARASAEVGTVFLTMALLTGSIWGKQAWNTWWTWDPRLTLTLVLWFLFVAYLMVRSYMGRTENSARAGAVVAVLGVVDIPIIYFSVTWWRTLHPDIQVGVKEALPGSVIITLMVALGAFTLFYVWLIWVVYRLQRVQAEAQRLRVQIEDYEQRLV